MNTPPRLRNLPVTPRQQAILDLLHAGLHSKAAAAHLKITLKTLNIHLQNARERLGVNTTIEAIRRSRPAS